MNYLNRILVSGSVLGEPTHRHDPGSNRHCVKGALQATLALTALILNHSQLLLTGFLLILNYLDTDLALFSLPSLPCCGD